MTPDATRAVFLPLTGGKSACPMDLNDTFAHRWVYFVPHDAKQKTGTVNVLHFGIPVVCRHTLVFAVSETGYSIGCSDHNDPSRSSRFVWRFADLLSRARTLTQNGHIVLISAIVFSAATVVLSS